jgi:beta-glucanase (GH16 family)
MPILRRLDLRGGSTRIGDPPSYDVGAQSETPANLIADGRPPVLRRSTALSFGAVVAVVVSLGVGAAGAALAPSLLSALQSVNSSPNQSGVFDNRQKAYNQALYDALQALDRRVTSLEDPSQPPPPPPPAGEPAPIAGQGYTKRFEDNFDGVALDTAKWSDHSFWRTAEPAPSGVAVSNGTVKITNSANTPGADCEQSRPCSVDIASGPEWGGSPSKYDFTYGYVEARMKFTGGRGSWPAFWLAPVSQADWANWPNCPRRDAAGNLLGMNYELDILEGQGDEPTTFYGTQHRNTNSPCGMADDNSRHAITNVPGLYDQFHVFAVKWTAQQVAWYVDDVQQGQATATWDTGHQRMYIILSMYVCGWDSTNSCTSATPNNLITEVDWVRVWQQ